MIGIIKVIVSTLASAALIVICLAWGKIDATIFPYKAGLLWLVLALILARLWQKQFTRIALIVGGALFAATIWSLTLVDFPPWGIERLPVTILWLIVLSPVLAATITGTIIHEGYLLSGGLTLLLGGIAVLPISIWNVQTHINELCADVNYVYPYITPVYGVIAITAMIGLGVGGAAIGHILRARYL